MGPSQRTQDPRCAALPLLPLLQLRHISPLRVARLEQQAGEAAGQVQRLEHLGCGGAKGSGGSVRDFACCRVAGGHTPIPLDPLAPVMLVSLGMCTTSAGPTSTSRSSCTCAGGAASQGPAAPPALPHTSCRCRYHTTHLFHRVALVPLLLEIVRGRVDVRARVHVDGEHPALAAHAARAGLGHHAFAAEPHKGCQCTAGPLVPPVALPRSATLTWRRSCRPCSCWLPAI